MRFKKYVKRQCAHIIQPGEYVIDTWNNQQCPITSLSNLMYCEDHDKYYCLISGHWHKHQDDTEIH